MATLPDDSSGHMYRETIWSHGARAWQVWTCPRDGSRVAVLLEGGAALMGLLVPLPPRGRNDR